MVQRFDTDWCKGYDDGADKITELNDKAIAKGTKEKVKEVEDAIKDGSLHVFDTSTFTVDGKELDSWKDRQRKRVHQRWLLPRVRVTLCTCICYQH